ncbi:hypothetical protein [Rhodanobacter hydrolyticus]|uniref:Uncharacterized protein n=1 Tax=Rhodanobacter hydrolyticus TaxID=2250595 RepID=A0ABW8J2L2_9GAMM
MSDNVGSRRTLREKSGVGAFLRGMVDLRKRVLCKNKIGATAVTDFALLARPDALFRTLERRF